jgi:hypothetical protein
MKLYSAGDCSVCGDAGSSFFVSNKGDGSIFFYCPMCGCAWASPPTPLHVDTVDPPEHFAPSGWRAAKMQEIQASGMNNLVSRESDWESSWARNEIPLQ